MNPERLAQLVKSHFDDLAPRYGMESPGVSTERMVNSGSVERRSYTITDGTITYHLKLARSPRSVGKLSKWHSLRRILHERYGAPEIVDWIDIPGSGFSGLLCERVPGRAADLASPRLTREIVALVSQLHTDEELRAMLRPLVTEGSCADYFNGVWIRRFKEDLALIDAQPPAFLASETLEWMKTEALAIERAVAGMEAFSGRASSPAHGDLWSDNILVADDGRWRIVDWDDLALGDPALEFAIILEQVLDHNPDASPAEMFPHGPDAGFSQRLEVCLRAQRLYSAIEGAAEYIEADALEEGSDSFREERKARHQVAVRSYTLRYGAG